MISAKMKCPFDWLPWSVFIVFGWLLVSCDLGRTPLRVLCIGSDSNGLGVELELQEHQEKGTNFFETTDLNYLDEDSLRGFRVILMSDLALEKLNYLQINALERFLEAGGNCLGINLEASRASRFLSPRLHQAFSKQSDGNVHVTEIGEGSFTTLLDADAGTAQAFAEQMDVIYRKNVDLNYSNLSIPIATPEYWFEIDTLVMSLNEPMEFEILGNGDVLFIERGGQVNLFSVTKNLVQNIAELPTISTQSNGLNGLALDPNFDENGFVFLSYLSKADSAHQRISRFSMIEGKLEQASEKIIMQIPIDKTNGWHGTNSLEFDRYGNLYISMGDFTIQTSDVAGYGQIDERPGNGIHDAQRTAANTNSYKGRILRIHPESDGTYTIPDGNLFSTGSSKTIPETYVMGCRNPYRFSLDSHLDILYFGDVGPDAWEDGEKGPRGYDELNVATSPGFYGWPYLVADNKPYRDYDYATNTLGALFNPDHLVNNSPNNSGLEKLPPAKKPVLWYHKGESEEFPYMGSGGMNIMAGPKYYQNDFPSNDGRFPKYYDENVFLYDWVRNWIVAIELDEQDFTPNRISPFLPMQDFAKIIDMKFGPEGQMYLLEYGNRGYQSNQDASIKRIRYAFGRNKPKTSAQKITGRDALVKLLPRPKGLEEGRELILTQACLTCHRPYEKIIGPSFAQIAERFFDDNFAKEHLPRQIIEGSAGNWPGNIIMPANPHLTMEQAQDITNYILSFKDLTY